MDEYHGDEPEIEQDERDFLDGYELFNDEHEEIQWHQL